MENSPGAPAPASDSMILAEGAESVTRKGGWAALACPSCHGVFRVRQGEVGHWVRCPHCQQRVKTPGAVPERGGGLGSPLMGRLAAGAPRTRGRRDGWRVKRHFGLASEELEWEEQSPKVGGANQVIVLTALGLILGFVTLFGVFFLMKKHRQPVGENGAQDLASTAWMTGPNEGEREAGNESFGEGGLRALSAEEEKEVQDLVRRYLACPTPDEMLPLLRPGGEELTRRVERYYQQRPWQPAEVDRFHQEGRSYVEDGICQVPFRNSRFEDQTLALVLTSEGWRVDWEASVGWGEMTREELAAQRPTEPVKLRVFIGRGHYYNYDFGDEDRWQSFEAKFLAEDERRLWLYCERNSPLERQLSRSFTGQDEVQPFFIEVRYPPEARSEEQVIVQKIEQVGWVRPLTLDSDPVDAASPSFSEP